MSISLGDFDTKYGPLTLDTQKTRNSTIKILKGQNNNYKVKWLEVSKHWKVQIKQEIETQSELHKQFPNNIMGINDWCEDSDVVNNKLQVKIAYRCPDDALPILDYVQNKGFLSDQVKLDLTEQILIIGYVLFQLDVQHSNIKPNNLIYSEKNNIILLTDFGSDRTHHCAYRVNQSSILERQWQLNCWFYCSKQMLEILDNEIDFREQEFERVNSNKQSSKKLYANNDRWALGIILIQMFITLIQPDSIQGFPALNNQIIDDCLEELELKVHQVIYEATFQLLKSNSTPKQIYEQFQNIRHSSSLKSAFFAQLHSNNFKYIFSTNPIISRFQKWRQDTQHIFNPFMLSDKLSVEKHKVLAEYKSNMKREIRQEQKIEISGYTKDNKLHGLGMMMRLNYYGIYEGIFEDGKFLWGAVLELNPEGQVTYYVGPYDLEYQAKHGKCYLQWYKEGPQNQFRLAEQHDGIIIIGLFEGKGKRVKYDLQTNEVKVIEEYVGEWERNVKHGHGDYKFQLYGQEHRYVGEFQKDMFHGQGTLYLEEFIKQVGIYEKNKAKGEHKLYRKQIEKDEWLLLQKTSII